MEIDKGIEVIQYFHDITTIVRVHKFIRDGEPITAKELQELVSQTHKKGYVELVTQNGIKKIRGGDYIVRYKGKYNRLGSCAFESVYLGKFI